METDNDPEVLKNLIKTAPDLYTEMFKEED